MPTVPESGVIRFVTDVWPLAALGVVGALIIRACVPLHPAPAEESAAPAFNARTAPGNENSHAMAALGALTPESSIAQVVQVLDLLVVDFDVGSSTLPQEAEAVLTRVAAVISARPLSERFEISAHTDGSGSPLADLELSRRRAQAVVDFLVNQGVPSQRLQARGAGDQDPVASGDTEESHLRNRRLEFALLP